MTERIYNLDTIGNIFEEEQVALLGGKPILVLLLSRAHRDFTLGDICVAIEKRNSAVDLRVDWKVYKLGIRTEGGDAPLSVSIIFSTVEDASRHARGREFGAVFAPGAVLNYLSALEWAVGRSELPHRREPSVVDS